MGISIIWHNDGKAVAGKLKNNKKTWKICTGLFVDIHTKHFFTKRVKYIGMHVRNLHYETKRMIFLYVNLSRR